MNQDQKLSVFRAQTENVRELNATWQHLKRSIHDELVKGNDRSVRVHTKLLALTYCAWAEALFSKLIHTPHGFDLGEIDQIKADTRTNGIAAGWKRCVILALRRVEAARSGHLTNVTQSLNRLVDEYIETPSLLRNKIAHGQVQIALNRDNTEVNSALTAQIAQLDLVKLDRLKTACQGLADIVEAIIESPQKGAMRDYWALSQRVIASLDSTKGYSLAEKVAKLRRKRQMHNNGMQRPPVSGRR